jgi:hypothetical protein
VDPTARNLLTKFYGVGTGDIAAYFLDASRAMPTLDRQYKAVNVAAWAERAGLDVSGASRYEDLVDKGVNEQMAAQGYGTVASFTRNIGQLGQIYGERYDQTDAENDVFFNDNEKRRRLVGREIAAFSGRAGRRSGGPSAAGSY